MGAFQCVSQDFHGRSDTWGRKVTDSAGGRRSPRTWSPRTTLTVTFSVKQAVKEGVGQFLHKAHCWACDNPLIKRGWSTCPGLGPPGAERAALPTWCRRWGVGVGGQRSEQAIAAERGRAGREGGEAGGRSQSRLVKGLAPAVSRADLALAQV